MSKETDYEPGWGGGGVTIASVKLASASDPAKVANILSVDTDGVDAKHPRVAWTANNVLQITAANLSYVTIDRREYDGVHIDLRFDPDDPATRAAWLKWLHTPLGQPATVRFAAVPSLDGNWIAAVAEDNDGWEFSPDYPVTLTSTRDPADHARVLYIVSTEESRGPPRVSWTNTDELQVTVPSRSYVMDDKREYYGVRIDLRFDPDDPAARSGGPKRQ